MRFSFNILVKAFLVSLFMFFFFIGSVPGHADDIVFWNKMDNADSNTLISEIGSDLTLNEANWTFVPAMFGNGWDNQNENSYAFVYSWDLIEDIREGALSFFWVPEDDGDTYSYSTSYFFSNGATNTPQNDKYQFDFSYSHIYQSFHVSINKRDSSGQNNNVWINSMTSPVTGSWKAGDKVHIALAWHNEPVILNQYIVALWVNGELVAGWETPTQGTLEGWRNTNPTTPFSDVMRIGNSIFPYSADEQLRGPIDNIVFWNYAKEDWSDRFFESPFALSEVLHRISALETKVENLIHALEHHRHNYKTGKGHAHNAVGAKTSQALLP